MLPSKDIDSNEENKDIKMRIDVEVQTDGKMSNVARLTSSEVTAGTPLLFKILTESQSKIQCIRPEMSLPGCSSIPSSLPTSNQPNGESMQFVTMPEHITSDPKLKDALGEIMNTDFETLLIIAQLLQKCIEINYKRLELNCGTRTENMHSILNKYIISCTSSIETLKQNSQTDEILHRPNSLEEPNSSISVTEGTKHISIPNETGGFTPKGPRSSWIQNNAISCQKPIRSDTPTDFASLADSEIVVPGYEDPPILPCNIKQEVMDDETPFIEVNPELSSLSVNIKEEQVETIEEQAEDFNDVVIYMNLAKPDKNKLKMIPLSHPSVQGGYKVVKSTGTKGNNTRKVRCKRCSACLHPDCGKCSNCLDKKKFGGPAKKRQSCIRRQCMAKVVVYQEQASISNSNKLIHQNSQLIYQEHAYNSNTNKFGRHTSQLVQSVPQQSVWEASDIHKIHYDPQVTLSDAWDAMSLEGADGGRVLEKVKKCPKKVKQRKQNKRPKKKKKYKCIKCGKRFAYADLYRNHLRAHKYKSYICELCKRIFTKSSVLQKHLKTHQRYMCTICKRRFVRESDLNEHMPLHTAEPYVCEHCHKEYRLKVCFLRHKRFCFAEVDGPYVCEHCHKSYTLNRCFLRHKRHCKAQAEAVVNAQAGSVADVQAILDALADRVVDALADRVVESQADRVVHTEAE